MTLILALVCREGIVALSDSQETFMPAGVKSEAQKLFSLGESIVWGASGHVGMSQVLRQSLDKRFSRGQDGVLQKSIEQLRPHLHQVVNEVQQAQAKMTVLIPGYRNQPPTLHALFCGVCKDGRPWLLEVDPNGACEQHEHRGVCAIGSAEHLARFAYASLRHLDIRNKSLHEVMVIGYSIMADALATSALWVGPPIQVWTVTKGGIREVPKGESDALADTARAWKQLQADSLSEALKRTAEDDHGNSPGLSSPEISTTP